MDKAVFDDPQSTLSLPSPKILRAKNARFGF
jgi:hypothetical protein